MQVLTDAKSYDEAVEMFSKQYIAAPAYYIVAGSRPNQGAVITRDRNILNDLWQLNVSSSDPNSWYLLETNYVRMYLLMQTHLYLCMHIHVPYTAKHSGAKLLQFLWFSLNRESFPTNYGLVHWQY